MNKPIVILIMSLTIINFYASDHQGMELHTIDLEEDNAAPSTITQMPVSNNNPQMTYSSQLNAKRCSLKKILKTPICCDRGTSWQDAIGIGCGITAAMTGFATGCVWCEGYFCFDASCSDACKIAWIGTNDCSTRSLGCISVAWDIKTALLGVSSLISGVCLATDPCVQNNFKCCRENSRALNIIDEK